MMPEFWVIIVIRSTTTVQVETVLYLEDYLVFDAVLMFVDVLVRLLRF